MIWLSLLLLVLLAAFLLLRWALQPERLGALLLQRAAAATGLELDVSRPATLGIWPSLQLELVGLAARMPGDAADLLRAERVAVGLPLAVLWAEGDVEFGELRLLRPAIDVAAVQRWLSRDAGKDTDAPPRLPPYALQIEASDGRLQGDGWVLEVDSVDATPMRSGQPFTVSAAATLLRDGADDLPMDLQLRMLPSQTPLGLAIDDVDAAIGAVSDAPALHLGGSLRIEQSTTSARLSLRFGAAWPERWPAMPAQLAGRLPGRIFDVDYGGAAGLDGRLQISSPPDATEPLRIAVVPSRLIAWLQQPEPKSPLPPADVRLTSDRVEIDGVLLEGLRIELHDTDPEPVDD